MDNDDNNSNNSKGPQVSLRVAETDPRFFFLTRKQGKRF
jgi:hypothetical protein